MSQTPDMYEQAYWDIQKILDSALGPNEEDGAGAGIVADVHLALAAAEARGRKQAARDIADGLEKALAWCRKQAHAEPSRTIAWKMFNAQAEVLLHHRDRARGYAAEQDTTP